MPKKLRHRGPDPEDERLFGRPALASLRAAIGDLCWLLDHGYALASATELVGNRYALARRQRIAIARCACPREARARRQAHHVAPHQLRNQELWLDGFNVLMVLEAALAGGVVLLGCDGCCRDVAGIHRRYHKVEETLPALQLIGELAGQWAVQKCRWWLDSPISNSGRLKRLMLEAAVRAGWDWEVELVPNPDRVLSKTDHIIATSDRVILDRCQHWFNLTRCVIEQKVPDARVLDLSLEPVEGGNSF